MEIVSPMCHASSAVTQLYAPTQNTYKSAPRLLTSCCTDPAQLAGERCQTWLCIVPISSSPGRAVPELHHVQGTSLQLMTTRAHFPPAFSVHPLTGGWLHHHVPKPQFSKGQVSLSSWALGNLIISLLGSAGLSAPCLPCPACLSSAACWRRPLW